VPITTPAVAKRRILLVEDEAPIRELLRLHLSLAGFEIEEVAEGTAALERARAEKFDLIVLDVMVPGLDGITLVRAIRSQSANMASAVMMLTARVSEADKVLGLESGADDYLTKPFSVREMVARVGAILRRNERIATSARATSRSTPNAAKRSSAAAPSSSPSRNSICSICSRRAPASCSAAPRC
jgi:DNA-binding response OmpR family regulator